jgi:hypothetical protein
VRAEELTDRVPDAVQRERVQTSVPGLRKHARNSAPLIRDRQEFGS